VAPADLSLSIVIGTKDRPGPLRRTLASIRAQTRRPDEVLLVDDGSLDPHDAAAPLAGAGIAVRYFNKSSDPGLTKSRNLGIRSSRGDVVMFLDDDVVLDEGYVAAIMDVYRARPEIGGVGGRLIGQDLGWAKRAFLTLFLLDSPREGVVLANGVGTLVRRIREVTPVQWLSGCNMSFHRRVFAEFMFDEAFGGNGWGDDRDFSYSVGRKYGLLATPHARIRHLEEPSGRAGRVEFGRAEIEYVHRFFAKHMPKRAVNHAALAWGLAGIVLHNCVALRRGRVVGNVQGIRAVLSRRVEVARNAAAGA